MPIDPNIPLAAHGLGPIVNPMEMLHDIQSMRAQREQADSLAEQRRASAAARAEQTAKLQRDAARQADGDAAVDEFLSTYKPGVTPMPTALVGRMYRAYGPERASAIVKMATDAQTADLTTADGFKASASRRLLGVLALPADHREAAYNAIGQDYIQRGLLKPEDIPPFSPETLDALAKSLMTPDKRWEIDHPKPVEVQPGNALVNPATGQAVYTAPPKAPTMNAGSFEDYVTRVAKEKGVDPAALTTKDIEAARKAYQQADDRPRITINAPGANDVKDTVQGMMDGTIPPQLPGRASKEYLQILGEAKRRGYNLAAAVTDWNATQKHIATMNGAQQLRLNQAISALPDMLDSVDALASKWKGGRFPILNKANLAAAKAGVYGDEVASVANQLDAQIADVTADLGNVYMGGNSPTDHALGLAGKSLKGEWDEKVLHDMVKLAKQNVTIRRNSIQNSGVAGASATNPYAPAAPAITPSTAPGVEQWVRDPKTGKMVRAGGQS